MIDEKIKKDSMIVVSEWHEVEITAEEYRKRLGKTIDSPKHGLFDAVEYLDAYKQPRFAMVTGFSPRSGGWYYTGSSLTMRGSETVEFSEKDVLRGWAA